MEDATMCRHWCHVCSQVVNPIMEPEIQCPFCESGFVEEIGSSRDHDNYGIDLGSDPALSLWAPILLGLLGSFGPSSARISAQEHISNSDSQEEEGELESESESLLGRRRSSSASILRMLQDFHSGVPSESENSENDRERSDSVILVNPLNEEALIIQGSFDMNQGQNLSHNVASSFGDHLVPGLDLLLQHLAENDTNRHGSPPAKKEAVKAMPAVTIEESMQCSVCLEDLDVGSEAKEMPCKHKFHSGCILPWLELHSSCPVCRFQLPSDDSKTEANRFRNIGERVVNNDVQGSNSRGTGGERRGNGRNFWIPIPWPFDGLFSFSGSQSGGSSTSAASSAALPGNAAHTDEN